MILLRCEFSGIFKQVAWAAGGTAIGGIFGGPVGAMVGGVAGWVLYMSCFYRAFFFVCLHCFYLSARKYSPGN